MAKCLIALGSNLGDRALHLYRALEAIERAPGIHMRARSAWHETAPIGGPKGQAPFLNGAVLTETSLEPAAVLAQLTIIEMNAGRVRDTRWAARSLDLDVLLYDTATWRSADLVIPHPRMHYRRFVLAPAAEVAPGMVHPTSAWTVARLLAQLDKGADEVAVASADPHLGARLVSQLTAELDPARGRGGPQRIGLWQATDKSPRPRLVMAVPDASGSDESQCRKILHLPATGPIAWLHPASLDEMVNDAAAVVASVWIK